MNKREPKRALVVGSGPEFVVAQDALAELGVTVDLRRDSRKAVEAFRSGTYDLVILGLRMRPLPVPDFIRDAGEKIEGAGIIVLMSSNGAIRAEVDAINEVLGPEGMYALIFPYEIDYMRSTIESALAGWRA